MGVVISIAYEENGKPVSCALSSYEEYVESDMYSEIRDKSGYIEKIDETATE